MKKFSEFVDVSDKQLVGKKLAIKDVLEKEIELLSYRVFNSPKIKDKPCLQIQFKQDNNTFVTFTNSAVLIRQLSKYGSNLPFLATIHKNGKYYTLI